MSPPFDAEKYTALMSGLEAVEIKLSDIDLGDRYDAEFFAKEYLHIQNRLKHCNTVILGSISKMVASAFYPAATDLYSIGDTPFIRCVDCIPYPVITERQDDTFERIPLQFAIENKGISFLNRGDIVITKVGSPCYASIVDDYDYVALSRTVLGLTEIRNISPEYLMVFLRCKFGIEQLFRHRELTIQYQLTLDRVKKVNVFIPSAEFQVKIKKMVQAYNQAIGESIGVYKSAESFLLAELGLTNFIPSIAPIAVKSFANSFGTSGRLDAEYYQLKYEEVLSAISNSKTNILSTLVWAKKSIEPGSSEYTDKGIPFVRVSDISKFGIASPEIHLSRIPFANMGLQPAKDTILFTKDGTVGIAYKTETDMDIITSSAILHLMVKDKTELLPNYLTLVLNSMIVQMQAERDTGGSVIIHWRPSDIGNVVIPILDKCKQEKLANMVQNSFVMRRQSELLLESAKRAIEIAIEDSEEKAIKFLEDQNERDN